MDVGKAIFNILVNDVQLHAVLEDRIYPNVVDYGATLPAVAYTEATNEPSNSKTGASTLDVVTVQISVFSLTYAEVVDISSKVRRALDYKVGIFEGVNVQRIFFQDSSDAHDKSYGETGVYQRNMDFLVRVKN